MTINPPHLSQSHLFSVRHTTTKHIVEMREGVGVGVEIRPSKSQTDPPSSLSTSHEYQLLVARRTTEEKGRGEGGELKINER